MTDTADPAELADLVRPVSAKIAEGAMERKAEHRLPHDAPAPATLQTGRRQLFGQLLPQPSLTTNLDSDYPLMLHGGHSWSGFSMAWSRRR
jgi:hypothetical protein